MLCISTNSEHRENDQPLNDRWQCMMHCRWTGSVERHDGAESPSRCLAYINFCFGYPMAAIRNDVDGIQSLMPVRRLVSLQHDLHQQRPWLHSQWNTSQFREQVTKSESRQATQMVAPETKPFSIHMPEEPAVAEALWTATGPSASALLLVDV